MGINIDLALATSANDLAAVPRLVEDLTRLATTLDDGGDVARHEMLLKARTLVQALETPRETMLKHTWAQPGVHTGLITGVDTGLWTLMAKGADEPQKVEPLAKELGMDPALLSRLLRHLAAMGYLIETDHDEYKLTNFSKCLSLPVMAGGYASLVGGIGRSPIEFHKFARATNWRNPVDANKTAMHMAYGTDQNVFEYLRSVGLGPQTNDHMGGYRQGRLPWMHPSIYPAEKELFPGTDSDPEATLVVDIAGGLGHDIEEFQRMYPNHPGKLVLQDLPAVIADAEKTLDPTIGRMNYDFHTEQPIKGARAYFMHSIMHDWPDDVCRSILARTAAAMRPGYSKLLIFDCVIPRTGAHWENTAGDILMMTQLAALERTEENWYDLIEKSGLGLRIVKFWRCGQVDVESVIECELA